MLSLSGGRYLVKSICPYSYRGSIDWDSGHMEVVDVGLQKGNCSFLPLHQLMSPDFSDEDHERFFSSYGTKVTIVSCSKQVRSRLYINTEPCIVTEGYYSYTVIFAWASNIEDSCTITRSIYAAEYILYKAFSYENPTISYNDIHIAMAGGFNFTYSVPQMKTYDLCFSGLRYVGSRCTSYDYCKYAFPLSAYAYTTNCLLWMDAKFVVEHSANDAISRDFHVQIAALDLEETFLVVLSISLEAIKMRRPAYAADDYLMHFEYRVLKKATKNLSEKSGEGGFSSVFRGALPDSTPIAGKKLMNQSQSNDSSLQKRVKKFLVYEYLANGSLAAHLFQKGSNTLNWKTRYGIATRIAKGLAYLHERCRDCILHYDIKPENMLLDSELEPQIADFCLAELMGQEVSSVITIVRGARGLVITNSDWPNGKGKPSVLSLKEEAEIFQTSGELLARTVMFLLSVVADSPTVCNVAEVGKNMRLRSSDGSMQRKLIKIWGVIIKRDVETQGDFINSLIREVERVAFTNIKEILPLVKWLDDKLSYLVIVPVQDGSNALLLL
ncbi:uncharacterized protein LOC108955973 [Eucalyptus grandis]|uniref:uncharacterized protein LOC108955973 n=1 Tax=Eucalyptus grandis TaxID=71139 RepID=UPI00192F0BEE|nr:uncharacterized protein LOC108955973 [Eucalyptus grandis]